MRQIILMFGMAAALAACGSHRTPVVTRSPDQIWHQAYDNQCRLPYENKSYDAALANCSALASQGNPYAPLILGFIYEFGNGAAQNTDSAIEYFGRAVAKGGWVGSEANMHLANIYTTKDHLNIAKAVECSEASLSMAESDRDQIRTNEAARRLGYLLAFWPGAPKDNHKALSLLSLSAQNGDIEGEIDLGLFYTFVSADDANAFAESAFPMKEQWQTQTYAQGLFWINKAEADMALHGSQPNDVFFKYKKAISERVRSKKFSAHVYEALAHLQEEDREKQAHQAEVDAAARREADLNAEQLARQQTIDQQNEEAEAERRGQQDRDALAAVIGAAAGIIASHK